MGRMSAPGAAELWVSARPLRTERVVSKPGGVGSTCRDGVLQDRQTHAQVAVLWCGGPGIGPHSTCDMVCGGGDGGGDEVYGDNNNKPTTAARGAWSFSVAKGCSWQQLAGAEWRHTFPWGTYSPGHQPAWFSHFLVPESF